MKTLRYTPEVQKQLGSKIKPEPWLHVILLPDFKNEGGGSSIVRQRKQIISCKYYIYVWDTREVVGKGQLDAADPKKITGASAIDNHEKLSNGFDFNSYTEPKYSVNNEGYVTKRLADKSGLESFEVATEALNLKPGSKVKVQEYNLGTDKHGKDTLVPEKPRIGKLEKLPRLMKF